MFMPYTRSVVETLLVGAFMTLVVCTAGSSTRESFDEMRLETLRHLARPAEERLVDGPEGDALRAQLVELDRALQEFAPLAGAPPVQSLRTIPSSAELDAHRAWIERARPALEVWVRIEPCDVPSDRISLRQRVESYWEQGRRIAVDPPRLQVLRRAANLLAWRASFDAASGPEDRAPCEIAPARILASTLTLAYAYDDASLIGTMARIAIEEQTLRAARLMLEQGTLSAKDVRKALEPSLARSAAFEPREMVEGELRAFFALYDRVASDGAEALVHLANAGDAFDLAQRSASDPADISLARDDAFLQSCRSALARVHRHRSLVVIFRIALALMEHRERERALPQHLEELAPAFGGELPRDPVSGAPIPYRFEEGRVLLGPTACPTHGNDACRHVDWAAAVEQMLAFEFAAPVR
jgi:hypothetical protein